MEWYIHYWRCQVDEKIWQCWSYSQKQHIVEQLIPTLGYLKPHVTHYYVPENEGSMTLEDQQHINSKQFQNITNLCLEESQFFRPQPANQRSAN